METKKTFMICTIFGLTIYQINLCAGSMKFIPIHVIKVEFVKIVASKDYLAR